MRKNTKKFEEKKSAKIEELKKAGWKPYSLYILSCIPGEFKIQNRMEDGTYNVTFGKKIEHKEFPRYIGLVKNFASKEAAESFIKENAIC